MALHGGAKPTEYEEEYDLARAPWMTSQVRSFRVKALYKAGFPIESAVALGGDPEVDWHRATDLLEEGCDPYLVVEILS